ncbi:Cytochrome P450_ family 2 subfamily j_ polypeptide 6, partial [Caligus rogercresseyi]
QKAGDNHSYFHIEQLVTICLDFFQAGAETSATTLLWCVLYMSLHPEVQSRCREEIADKLRDGELPTQNALLIPYTHATLMEVQGIKLLYNIIKSNYQEINVNGYQIPKNTEIYSNLMSFHRSPEFFPDPMEFKPERFLSEDGRKVVKMSISTFRTRKTHCMGESLARHPLISPSKKYGKPDPESCFMGITRIPTPFHVEI